MKCTAILALATGAYAVQDTTPPVISLTLAHTDTTTNPHVARSCAVFSKKDDCPDPLCGARDHHDGQLACTTVVKMINDDGATSGTSIDATYSTADRNIRSEWLYKYDASDKSGNAAETVTFELTIYDHVDPVLTIGAPWDVAAITPTTNYQAQSCNMGNSPTNYANAAPCTWPVTATSASAVDTYDKTNMQIMNSVTAPGQTAVIANLATHNIDTQKLGDWKLYWSVCDNADIYGAGGQNNCVDQSTTVTIDDTWKPILTKKEATKARFLIKNSFSHKGGEADWKADTYECGVDSYVEHGAFCKDLRSSMNAGSFDADHISPEIVVTVDIKLESAMYKVTYDCKDDKQLHADTISRPVVVVDTLNPEITLGNNVDSTIENSAGAAMSAEGHKGETSTGLFDATYLEGENAYTCTDKCYDNPVTVATLHYGGDCTGNLVGTDGALTNFPEYTAGDYSIKYVCTDKPTGGLSASTCRKIQNVDHTRPVIQILGSDEMTLEATHEGNYIDDGATCSDQVDGVISQNVEVSGDVVNLSKVGAYTITYNCKDSAGNTAPTLSRKVHVKQTSCPTCVITGADTHEQEASFPYTDEGALCTDIIDGRVDTITGGDTVDVQTTGVYTVTYRAQNSVGLYNDGKPATGAATATSGCRGTAVSYTRVVTVKDTLKPVIHLSYAQEGNIAWGSAGANSLITGADNVAQFKGTKDTYTGNNYMAEEASTSSVNGWVLGAVASAVTGLALLGFSQRKTTVATSVPV